MQTIAPKNATKMQKLQKNMQKMQKKHTKNAKNQKKIQNAKLQTKKN